MNGVYRNDNSTDIGQVVGVLLCVKSRNCLNMIGKGQVNAEGGIRTPTPLRGLGPQPSASANSATSASYCLVAICALTVDLCVSYT